MSFEEAVFSIMEDLECTWAEAEAVYLEKQADAADAAYERYRDREMGI